MSNSYIGDIMQYEYAKGQYDIHLGSALLDEEASDTERLLYAAIAIAIALGVKAGFHNDR